LQFRGAKYATTGKFSNSQHLFAIVRLTFCLMSFTRSTWWERLCRWL